MKKGIVLSIAALLTGCVPQIDPRVTRDDNKFRDRQICQIAGNYVQDHNSGTVNFGVVQTKSSHSKGYTVTIETTGVPHNFPNDAVMLLSIDGRAPIRLHAMVSDKKETTRMNYAPGYMVGGQYPYYVPGYTYLTTDRNDIVLFGVQEELLKEIARSKSLRFSIEGRGKNLEGSFIEGNFLAVNNFVNECINNRPPLKQD